VLKLREEDREDNVSNMKVICIGHSDGKLTHTGHLAIANHPGSVNFSSNLIIHNVLYVLEFSLYLISVAKLCIASGFTISFDDFNLHVSFMKNSPI
jgi:hypothetical protein